VGRDGRRPELQIGPVEVDKGTYLTVFKKQSDGSWKAVEDFTASEIPPPAPK
jgi:ketosteroid isomerase-like protein